MSVPQCIKSSKYSESWTDSQKSKENSLVQQKLSFFKCREDLPSVNISKAKIIKSYLSEVKQNNAEIHPIKTYNTHPGLLGCNLSPRDHKFSFSKPPSFSSTCDDSNEPHPSPRLCSKIKLFN